MLGYLVVLCVAVLCAFTYWLLLKIRLLKIKRKLHVIECVDSVKIQAIKVEREYLKHKINRNLKRFPTISMYLSQSTYMIDSGGPALENIELVQMSDNKEILHSLVEEIINAPDDIRKLLFTLAETLDQLAEAKNPVKYRIRKAKKNMELRFLEFLVKLMSTHQKQSNEMMKEISEKEIAIKNSDMICASSPA